MKEFINNLFKVSNERLKNPLIFSFLISWIALNWKAIFVLFTSKQTIEDRIIYITNNFSETRYTLFYPLLIALGYVIVLPYLSMIIDIIISLAIKNRRTKLINDKINEFYLKNELAKSERTYENIRAGNEDLSKLNNKITELNQQKFKLETDLITLKNNKKLNEIEISHKNKVLIDIYFMFLEPHIEELDILEKNINLEKDLEDGISWEIMNMLNEYSFIESKTGKKNMVFYELTSKGSRFLEIYQILKLNFRNNNESKSSLISGGEIGHLPLEPNDD